MAHRTGRARKSWSAVRRGGYIRFALLDSQADLARRCKGIALHVGDEKCPPKKLLHLMELEVFRESGAPAFVDIDATQQEHATDEKDD